MDASPRILVIGGTSGTGLQIVDRLLRQGYPVRVLARNPAGARLSLAPDVEIVPGDITKPETLLDAMTDADHLIFTAGITGRFADEVYVRALTYEGLRHTLAAARQAGLRGRFLYMTTVGVTQPSPAAHFLDLTKRHILKWRRRAEEEIRGSGLEYTIIRAGILTNDPARHRGIVISQGRAPLSFAHRVSRADVAEIFVHALAHPGTRRTTFNVVGTPRSQIERGDALFAALRPDV